MGTTLAALQAGSCATKLVVAIEGVKYLLSDAPSAAVLDAWTGEDWTEVLGGLFVELKNSQSISQWDPIVTGGSCQIRVAPDEADTFGKFVHKRAVGAETQLTATINRTATTIPVTSTQDFPSSGVAYCGTETFSYSSKLAASFIGATRGLYSPFGTEDSGSGSNYRFATQHRVGQDPNQVLLQPIVSQLPRVWIGRRLGIWLHLWDEATQALNSRADAQLIFAGRIASIADDPNDFCTVLDAAHVIEEIRDGIIGKDIWSATIPDGIDVIAGRVFKFNDKKTGYPNLFANDLTVVASGAAGTNQINAGRYSLGNLCEALNTWLAGETAASRIYGSYTWHSPVTSNLGLRSKCYWQISDADSTLNGSFGITMPGEICAFLGLKDAEPGSTGQAETWPYPGPEARVNTQRIAQGAAVPFLSIVFKPLGPGRVGQEYSEIMNYETVNERGTFVDQYSYLPSVIKSSSDSTKEWGIFLLADSVLMVASYDAGTLTGCWLAPFQLTGDKDAAALGYFGRRADEPQAGPVSVRQVFVLESTLLTLLSAMLYGTGTSGYNHSAYDDLGFGLGLGIPGELLGGAFERSIENMAQADMPIQVVIDEPTKFVDLFSADLLVRRAFLRWKNEVLEFAQWKTPVAAISVASLTESNKAAPAGHVENHRTATVESAEDARPVCKLDFDRDFAVGRDGQYLRSLAFEDRTAVDDAGGSTKAFTLKLRNIYHDAQVSGASIEALMSGFLQSMPILARPFNKITRSIDQRYFEGYAPGDVFVLSDSFARDPITGERGIDEQPVFISRISYDLGGPSPDGSTRPVGGDLDALFLDVHRGNPYAPSAEVDEGQANAGYDVATKTLTCFAHKYSHSITITYNKGRGTLTRGIGEPADATNFPAGSNVLVVEMDPADPTTPLYWEDTVASQTGDAITLTDGLAGWDPTKKYRLTFQKYSQVATAQQTFSYQADQSDMMVEDTVYPFHYAQTQEIYWYTRNSGTEKAELIPTMTAGDGRALDVGTDRAITTSVTQYIDRKSRHQSPVLWGTEGAFAAGTSTVIMCGLVFLGTDHSTATITRGLTVAPYMRVNSGGTGTLKVTISRFPPIGGAGFDAGTLTDNARFIEAFDQYEWSTTSSTGEIGADHVFNLSVKDHELGYVWVTIEGQNIKTRGLAKFVEGPRVLNS
jgi:hypothetical protein